MFLTFALFEAIDATGMVESFLVFPTDAPTVIVDRLRDVRGRAHDRQVDLGGLRFYSDEEGLKIRRLVSQYGPPAFHRHGDDLRLELEHTALPVGNGLGYYTLLLPQGFYGHLHATVKTDLHWLTDSRRLLVSMQLLDHRGYLATSVRVSAELSKNAEPGPEIARIRSRDVYADWSTGPHHVSVRSFIRAANASVSGSTSGVFLCHSHEDKQFARKLAIALAGAGFRVWIDEAEIRVGESLIGKIEEGISGVTHLVAILSPASLQSRWCREELRMALARQIGGKELVVLPVLLGDCEPPGFLQEKRYADFRKAGRFAQSVRELCEAIA
jgi:hypothetical protein